MRLSGYGDRSQFIRDTIWEKLEQMGLAGDREAASSPIRVGKGGVAQVHSGTGHNIFRQQSGLAGERSRKKAQSAKGTKKKTR